MEASHTDTAHSPVAEKQKCMALRRKGMDSHSREENQKLEAEWWCYEVLETCPGKDLSDGDGRRICCAC